MIVFEGNVATRAARISVISVGASVFSESNEISYCDDPRTYFWRLPPGGSQHPFTKNPLLKGEPLFCESCGAGVGPIL